LADKATGKLREYMLFDKEYDDLKYKTRVILFIYDKEDWEEEIELVK